MANYLLVDGNNLACRAAFANADLKIDLIDFEGDFNPDDAFDDDKTFPTGAIHGFFRSLASLRAKFPDSYLAVIWDSGYKRRLEVSTDAMNRGVIPEPYKSNRNWTPHPRSEFWSNTRSGSGSRIPIWGGRSSSALMN